MAAKKKSTSEKKVPLLFKLSFENDRAFDGKVIAYAFDRTGNVLGQAHVDDGQAALNLPDERLRGARVFFAPAVDRDFEPTLSEMKRLNAYEPIWQFQANQRIQEILPVPDYLVEHWSFCICRVRGRVVRPVEIGGTTEDMPVCNARVHVCEVDKWPIFVYEIPDELVIDFRDLIVHGRIPDLPPVLPEIPEGFDPLPPPFPGPGPDPRFQSTSLRLNSAIDVRLNPQPEVPSQPAEAFQPLPVSALDPTLRVNLTSNSVQLVRQAMAVNQALIAPYLCWWPYLLHWYRCDEILTLETDSQGRFDGLYIYPCSTDHPDLHFWVEYQVGGSWETVYRRPIPCDTYWNYACGSEVTIRVTDPRVPPCSNPADLPGCQLAVISIGNNVSMSEIQGALAGASEGLTTSGRPFGGNLEPHVWFSRSTFFAKGITHYRWSYRRLTGPDGITPNVGGWHVMDRNVIRHYSVIDSTTDTLSFPADPMGPDPTPAIAGLQLFRIQPLDPPSPGIDWVQLDAREDTATAFFETAKLSGGNPALAAGKYEMKLELFKSDGSLVNMTAEGISVKEATTPAPFGTATVETAAAPAEHLITSGGDIMAYRVVVRVDNNPCVAVNHPITGSGMTIDAVCGFVEYAPGATATLHFRAFHPNDFATLRFRTHRGSSINVPQASATGPVASPSLNGFVRDVAGNYQKTVPVATLLTSNTPPGNPPCESAAFAQTLEVDPLATDGWSVLTGLRAVGTPLAYALTPQE